MSATTPTGDAIGATDTNEPTDATEPIDLTDAGDVCATCGRPVHPPETAPTRRRRSRSVVVVALVVVGCLSFTLASVGIWARRNVADTDRWTERSAAIIADPAVQAPLAAYMTAQLMLLIDPEQLFEEALPERGRLLAGPLANAVEDFVRERVERFVATERFRTLWVEANELAHRTVVQVLRGENDAVGARGDRAVINLVPIINEALADIGEASPELFGREIDIPELKVGAVPALAISRIERAFDVELGDDFGQFTVYDRGRLQALQDGLQTARRLLVALIVVTLVALPLALWSSTRRRRTLLQILAGLALGLALIRRLAIRGQEELLGSIRLDGVRGAAKVVSDQFVDPLLANTQTILLGLALVAAIALLSGPYRWAVWLRRNVMALGRVAGRGGSVVSERAAGAAWVRTNRSALQIGGVVVAVLALIVLDLSFVGLAVLAALFVVYEAVLHEVPGDVGAA
jgi:hypothetical protein